jgi:hypothetical protein
MEFIFSTFQPSFSQQGDSRTIKTISPTILSGESTDATIGPSILDLPVDNLQKLQNSKNKESDKDKRPCKQKKL